MPLEKQKLNLLDLSNPISPTLKNDYPYGHSHFLIRINFIEKKVEIYEKTSAS
jgi:hypothetical protein